MNITVYCGSADGNDAKYTAEARKLGEWIADNGHTLVYGAGRLGLMGAVSQGVLDHGGKVIGVIPGFLATVEQMHPDLTQYYHVETMGERKAIMIELGEAFVALPGGPGTLEEIAEIISRVRLGLTDAPCILFDQDGYYQPLRAMLDAMVASGFYPQDRRDKVFFVQTPDELLAALQP